MTNGKSAPDPQSAPDQDPLSLPYLWAALALSSWAIVFYLGILLYAALA